MKIRFAALAMVSILVVSGCSGGAGSTDNVNERLNVNYESICFHKVTFGPRHPSNVQADHETLVWLNSQSIEIDGLVSSFGVAPTIYLVSECGLQQVANEQGKPLSIEVIDGETYERSLEEFLQAAFGITGDTE